MSRPAVLHVGTMKSGTSYVQDLLFAQQEGLAAAGVLLPGRGWADQVRAVRQTLGPGRARRPLWDAMASSVAGHDGPAVISMEYLGPAPPKIAKRVVSQLGEDVLVVLTVRDLNRTLVSMWQETVQNGRTWTWEQYLEGARRRRPHAQRGDVDRDGPGGTFWRQQDLVRIAEDWVGAAGAGRVAVVTLPHPGAERTLLGQRFVEATGLPIDLHAPVRKANESLGLPSVLALRRLNELLDEQGLVFPAGSGVRKRLLAKTILAARRSVEPTLGLEVAPWVAEQATQTVEGLRRISGLRLVGDWADLEPVPVPGVSPADVPEGDVTAAALAGLAGLVADRIQN